LSEDVSLPTINLVIYSLCTGTLRRRFGFASCTLLMMDEQPF
jgi:hypothetical protein